MTQPACRSMTTAARNVVQATVPSEIANQPEEPLVRIHLIGAMRATTFLGADVLPRGRKAQAILGCLCLAAGAPLRRGELAAMLWDRVTPFQARASFRQAFRELTVALGPLGAPLVAADRDTIWLDASACWIDALAVTGPMEHAERRELASHCTGDLLAGLDDVSPSFREWLVAARARFDEKLGALLAAESEDPDALARAEIARRVLAIGPTYEGASRVLMRALADLRRSEEALAEFVRCRDALSSVHNCEPSSETRELHEAIRKGGAHSGHELIPFTWIAPRKVPAGEGAASNPSRPRVAVLPFRAKGAGANDEALSLSLEIAAELGRFRWFDVVNPMALGGGGAQPKARVAKPPHNELDCVIDGTVSITRGGRLLDVRLLDMTRTASRVWNARVALAADAPSGLDDVTADIVKQIDPVSLFMAKRPKRSAHQAASNLVLRAIPLMYSMERAKYEEAGELLREARAQDPGNAKAAAWSAYWHVFYVGQDWAADAKQAFATARGLAQRAIDIDPNNAEALGICGHISSFLDHDFDKAISYFGRSLRLNPSLAHIWALSAPTYCYIGQPDEALRRLARYRELAPFDPYFGLFETMYPVVYVFKNDYQRAAEIGRRVVRANPKFSNGYKPLIAALGHLGLAEEAQSYVAELRRLEPHFSVASFRRVYPFRREIDRDRYADGLMLAGVPPG